MATFTVDKHICDVQYSNKNTIIDEQFNSPNLEKSRFISAKNVGNIGAKKFENVTVSSNGTLSQNSFTMRFFGRDTLPLQGGTFLGTTIVFLRGTNNQPTIRIDCSGTGLQNQSQSNITNPNVGGLNPLIPGLTQTPTGIQ
jgi:hypothetical protein